METFISGILLGLLFISVFINVIFYFAWKNIRGKEQNRFKRIDEKGWPIYATVTQVIHQKRHIDYVVRAQWLSPETGKMHYFQDTQRFLRGALNSRPKIHKGDIVQVNVIFGEFVHRIKRIK